MEICYDGVWGSVCDSGWDYWDAAIVCLQMGFQGTSKLHYSVCKGWKLTLNFYLLGKTDIDNQYMTSCF